MTNSITQDYEIVNRLRTSGVKFDRVYQQRSLLQMILVDWILPFLPLILIAHFLTRNISKRMGGGKSGVPMNMQSMMFGSQSGAKQYVVSDSASIKFADVAGEDEAKRVCRKSSISCMTLKSMKQSAPRCPREHCSWALPVQAKHCWLRQLPVKPVYLSSQSPAVNSWKCLSVWAPVRFVTSSSRQEKRLHVLSLLMRLIPSVKTR